MIQDIFIKNFRCFEEITVDGFDRLNLIGGKNNSGKTCLLEAITALTNGNSLTKTVGLRNSNPEALFFKEQYGEIVIQAKKDDKTIETKFQLSSNGFGGSQSDSIKINFISPTRQSPSIDLLSTFDEFDTKKVKDKIIEIIKIVDDRIEDIRTYSTKGSVLYVSSKGENYKSLNSYGDAVKQLIYYLTPIFEKEVFGNNPDELSILCIDEIENGIHYSAHEEFWTILFTLSKRLNVQVFATTHSLEMITAFNKVSSELGGGAYIELMRNVRSGKIVANKRDPEQLEYAIENKTGFRGE